MDSKQEDCDARNDDKTMPLFFFFSCKTSGNNFMIHKIMDLAVHCWPYKEDAPMFYMRIRHNCRSGNSGTNSSAVAVISKLLKWIHDTTVLANSELGLNLYPVLFAHGGETFQFLFLFRMLESYDLDPRNSLEAHNIHFADPLPVLQQYKDAKHPWLLQSRSLGLGSLLNDWFPVQFTYEDLLESRSRGALIVKLYTQCSLHWLLYRTPIYNTNEWIEFYEGERYYQEDKRDLQVNLPAIVVGIQRKLTIKHLLKHGYNWSRLISLYTSCVSLQHFQQELRDMDIKNGAARRITLRLNEMNLVQDGSREYKVRIKSNMPYAKFYHLTDARGRRFILRVANVLPPCICSLIDPPDNRWKVPENLLQINLSDIWDPKTGLESHKEMIDNCQEVKGQHGDGSTEQNADQPITMLGATYCYADQPITSLEETDSDADWEISSEPENQCVDENGELLDSYIKVQTYRPTTTLQKGLPAFNPFRDPSQEWQFEEVTERKEECQKELSLSASNSQSNTEDITLLTNQMASSRLSHFKPSNQKDAASANQKPSTRAFYSTSSDSTSASQIHHPAVSNQIISNQWHHSQSTNHRSSSSSKQCHSEHLAFSNHSPQANNISSTNHLSSPAGHMERKTAKHSNSTNQRDKAWSHDFNPIEQYASADFNRRSSKQSTSFNNSKPKHFHNRPPTNPGLPAGFASSTESHHCTSANQNGLKHFHHRPPTNPGLPAGFASSTESHHCTSANQNGSKHFHHRPPTNPGLPAGFALSTESHHCTSANQNGSKQSHHCSKTNHDSHGGSLQSTATSSNLMVSMQSHDSQSANQIAQVGADHSKATPYLTTLSAENPKGQKCQQGKGGASVKRRRQKKSKRDNQN